MPTHKKGQDRDKYYHLAKEQGFRSRAAFKLIQINRRFSFLDKAKVLIDLCAAPGGWCQVAAKNMPSGSLVLGVDLLPIKAIRNVKTLVSDITTAECRKLIVNELQGWKADVVLCDGAPNIGSAYSKDAYVQNELVIAALKTATDHLREGGTFCTKIYRSTDYNAIIWALQQLFEDVQTMKPNSSRSQSSEIFVVCLKYTAPLKIDPKLLDPNHLFKEVSDGGLKKVDVLHKKYDKSNKRHRTGYDDSLGITLRSTSSVSEFVRSKEPVQMLTDLSAFDFTDDCRAYLDHPKTTDELKTCFADLRVLGKIDFKKILKWRMFMRDNVLKKAVSHSDDEGEESEEEKPEEEEVVNNGQDDRSRIMTEEEIQAEIRKIRIAAQETARKEKKKVRAQAAKQRERQALGMTHNAFAETEDMELFAIAEDATLEQLKEVSDIQLLNADDPAAQVMDVNQDHHDLADQQGDDGLVVVSDEMEQEMESDYIRYITAKHSKMSKHSGKADSIGDDQEDRLPTHKKARQSKQSSQQVGGLAAQDVSIAEDLKGELDAYVAMLSKGDVAKRGRKGVEVDTKGQQSDDSDDEEEEEEDEMEQEDEEDNEDQAPQRVVSRGRLSGSAMVDKWFSHPIFSSGLVSGAADKDSDGKRDKKGTKEDGEMEVEMPKTEKQLRKEKRKKAEDRSARKRDRRKLMNGEDAEDDEHADDDAVKFNKFTVVAAPDQADGEVVRKGQDNTEARDLIKRGLGRSGKGANKSDSVGQSFEVVAQNAPSLRGAARKAAASAGEVLDGDEELEEAEGVTAQGLGLQVFDDRLYDSDHEVYDSHDKIVTLALGTMMLRQSRKKALVDASYNRYAWNDPSALPSWFLDDETRHNKPQLPIPQALLDQIKSRYQTTGSKEIKKVAEARMRKRKRALTKLKAAKKVANSMAENSEMTEKQKLKAITKAMRTSKVDKPGKVYVVTKHTKSGSSGTSMGAKDKGKLKFVDKRMKKDARAMKRIEKNGKKRRK